MQYKILEENIVYKGFLKIKKALVQYDSFLSSEPVTAERECMERGDGVGILLYERDTDSLLMTRQFRYPSTKHGIGWLEEVPAGVLEAGEDPKDCAAREVEEETGYRIRDCRPICTFYVSPGGNSERIFLFYAEVDQADKLSGGGGKADEQEDIEIRRYPAGEIPALLAAGHFHDAKTLIALQWFLLQQHEK